MNSKENLGTQTCVLEGRVIHEDRSLLTVKLKTGEEIRAAISGSLHHNAETKSMLPTVGDFVLCSYNPLMGIGRIEKVCPRKTVLLRKVAGEYAGEQILGANLDTVFYLNSLNMDLNLRRMERYLVMIRDGGINPVVILTKADLISKGKLEEVLEKVKEVSRDIPVHVTSIKKAWSFKSLSTYFKEGETVAFLGSSGVGKSTLTNIIAKSDLQVIQDIRDDDDKGKHTTTARSLIQLDNGCFIMDTPGIREIQLWEGDSGLDETFKDIALLSEQCRFGNCSHGEEPDCAVNEALESGELCELRLASYRKLLREQHYMAMKSNSATRAEQKKIWKSRSKASRRGRGQY